MASYLILLAVLLVAKDVAGVTVNVTPKYQVVKEGETVTMLCQVAVEVQFCRVVIPGEDDVRILSPDRPPADGFSYYGEGLVQGQCGVQIERVKAKHNGILNCSMATPRESKESVGSMMLVVAKAPGSPELSVSVGSESPDYYKEGESIFASCVVRNGRPAANISWYLDDQKLYDGVQQATITGNDLYTVEQNFTRALQASDNGKALRCVAQHPLLSDHRNSSGRQLVVKFPPKPSHDPIEYFGLVEGEEGRVIVIVKANPKPDFIWNVGDQDLLEGETDDSGRFRVEYAVPDSTKGPGNWESVLIINPLKKEDVERNYILTAKNNLGDERYKVVISTSPEPKVLELGAGLIAIIVLAVLVILILTSLLLFARAKGRWCFAGKAGRNAGESSDTESAENHGGPKPKAIFTSVFKKKSDKVSADPPILKDVTVNDEKGNDEVEGDEGTVQLKPKGEEGVVYAELDLQNAPPSRGLLVRPENDKTEYAEIIHTKDNK